MGTDPFAGLVRRLAAQRARRRALGLLGLAGLAGLAGSEAVDARKKKRNNKKKKKRRVGAPPTTAAPVARADASCMFPDTGTGAEGSNATRVAQTFLAQRTGQLTQATVKLRSNAAGAAFTIEI